MLVFENAVKKYGKKNALDNFSAEFESGKIYALAAPNGHGKTTLMKTACGLVKLDSGICRIDGKPVCAETRKLISYMPTEMYFYKHMNIEEIGKYYRDFYRDFSFNKYQKLIKFMELDMKMKPSAMSSGMCAKLKISVALARRSKITMLDEPLNGIDLIARDMIIQTIIQAVADEACVIISSHLFDELETVTDSVVMMKDGKNVLQGGLEDIRMERGLSMSDLYREIFSTSSFDDIMEEIKNA